MVHTIHEELSAHYTPRRDLARNWYWFIVLGVLTLIAGALAIIVPMAAALAIEIAIGAILIADGVLQGIHANHLRGWPGNGMRILCTVLSLGAGALLLLFPFAGIAAITLAIGCFFTLSGVFRAMWAFQYRGNPGATMLGVSAALSLVLGLVLLAIWPALAPVVLSALVAIHLLFTSSGLFMLGLTARHWRKEQEPAH